jgi:hypothetical protein
LFSLFVVLLVIVFLVLLIGAFSTGSNVFTGRIANVLVYNRVLTDAEIKQNFEALRGRYGI